MPAHYHVFRYIGIAAIALLLVGLLGWYFFLRTQTGGIAGLDAARGFDIAVPSFTGSRSSTAENISGGVGTESLLVAQAGAEKPPRLWKVSTSPVAGAGFIVGSTTLRYVERSTGHIYDANPLTGGVTRVTKELVPKVYDATIVGTSTLIMRMLDEEGIPATIIGRLGTSTDDGFTALATSNLGGTIRALAASPTTPEIVMLAAGGGGATHLIRAREDGSSPRQLLSMGVGGFSIEWLADQRLFLTEKPASGILGNAYEVVQGALAPVVRGVPGLMILPRTSSGALLYSSDDGARVRLFARTSAQASPSELSLQTLAEKCVWAHGGSGTSTPTLAAYCAAPQSALPPNFTDLWLRGAAHTMDTWFRIDVSAAKSEKFFTPETSVALDVEHPRIDPSGEYIAFTNARDKSLWVLRIEE